MRKKRFGAANGILPIALCCLSLQTHAMDEMLYETAFASEDDFLASVPIVLTATRISQRVTEVPASMTIIDRDMIRASGFRELVDVLRLVPGFQVAHGNGNYFVPTYHGLVDDFPRRMLVQVDGRSVYLPMLSSVSWNHLGVALEDVERIEVIRGSNNSVNGSNAFLGVVNIITRQPFQDQGSTVQIVAGSLQAGAVRAGLDNEDTDQIWDAMDAREVFLRHGFSSGNWDARISGKYREDQGFARVHDSKYIKSLSARIVGSLNTYDQLDVQLGITDGVAGVGYENCPDDVGNPVRNMDTRSNYQYVTWSRALSGGDELMARAYHNYFFQDDEHVYGPFSHAFNVYAGSEITPADIPILFPGIEDKNLIVGFHDGIAERYDVELQRILRKNRAFELVFGAGLRKDTFSSHAMLGHNRAVNDKSARVFANINLHVNDQLNVNVGNMVEHNEIVGVFYSSRLAANYAFNDSRAIRLSISHSERSPSLLEANIYNTYSLEDGQVITIIRVAAEDQRTEKLNSLELGFVERFSRINSTLDVKLFREQLRDAIFDATDEGYAGRPVILDSDVFSGTPDGVADIPVDNYPFVYLNGVDANLNGVEVQLQFRPQRRTFLTLQYSYIEADATQLRFLNLDGSDPNKATYRNISEGVPYHTVSMLASHQFQNKWEISTGFYRMTEMRWFGDGDTIPAYRRVDARVEKSLRWQEKRARFALVLQNLQKDYEEFRMENKFDQRAYLQGSLSF